MIKSYSIIEDHDGMRIDRWIKKNIQNIPQSLIEKLLRSGKIKVDEKKVKSNFKISKKNKVIIYNLSLKNKIYKKIYHPTKKTVSSNEKEIIYNNENYLVVNKKAGISVQSGTKSLKNLVDIYSKSKFFKNNKPYTVHRLDKETSGILIFAKNRKTAQLFTSLFRLRRIHKTYIAICNGGMSEKKGVWTNNLIKYEGKKKVIEKAITKFRVINKSLNYSLVEFKPITGRKHQLRKQSLNAGHPIVGDNKYSLNMKSSKRLFLHALSIKFILNDKKISHYAPLPDYFLEFTKTNYLNFSN